MSNAMVDKVVKAVLYEGYVLYPYRPSSVKNRHRWTFGGIYPRAYAEGRTGSDAWETQTQCVVVGNDATTLRVTVRFLHLTNRVVTGDGGEGGGVQTWQEATERAVELEEIALGDPLVHPRRQEFAFAADRQSEVMRDAAGVMVGTAVRERESLEGTVDIDVVRIGQGLYRVTVRVSNQTNVASGLVLSRDAALMRSLVSTHAILVVSGGEFVSMTDPPEAMRHAVAECRNVGSWPVLVGEEGRRDTVLASPIILYDYPQIAPESPGDLFDATEIDEILSLRIMTLTEEEKKQAAAVDARVGEMLARTESLAREQLMNLHGTVRGLRPAQTGGGHG